MLTLRFVMLGVALLASVTHASSIAADDGATYLATEYAFKGPEQITAGWQTITIVNQGRDLHQLQLIRLPEGKTAADFRAAMAADPTRLPSWSQRRSGPNSVVPGEYATAVVHLEAGEYVALCGIPDKRGVPHVVNGMLMPVQVKAAARMADKPAADLTITLADFAFELSAPVKAGARTIHVVNKGSQAHEVVLVQLAPGASVNDFLDAFRPGVASSPAGKPIGGLVGLDPGREGFFRADFSPGRYGLICFLPDLVMRGPHFARGMLLDFEVRP